VTEMCNMFLSAINSKQSDMGVRNMHK